MEKRIRKLEIILSLLLLFIPLILILLEGNIRDSISNYAYSKYNFIFTSLLTIAGMMFVFNGTVHNFKWYNIILGCSLIGVANTPHLDMPIFHYLFAVIFFLGSVCVMIIFSSVKQRIFKMFFAFIILLGMIGYFVFNYYSLLWAEWISILPICIHYIGESTGKLD